MPCEEWLKYADMTVAEKMPCEEWLKYADMTVAEKNVMWGMIKVHWLDCGRKNARGRRWISSSASLRQKRKARRREASLLGAHEDGVLPLPNLPRAPRLQRATRRRLETKKGQRSRERKRRRSNWLFLFFKSVAQLNFYPTNLFPSHFNISKHVRIAVGLSSYIYFYCLSDNCCPLTAEKKAQDAPSLVLNMLMIWTELSPIA